MKKITLLFFLLSVTLGYSQVVMEDFETLPAGEFTGFEGLAGANIVADPAMGGANGQVGEIISSSAGQGWQGAQLLMQSNFMDLTTTNTVAIDVYSDVAFTLFAKVEDNINTTAPASAADEAHTGSGWETLTFTFNESLDGTVAANGEYNLLAIFPNWNGSGWNTPPGDFSIYVDNITAVQGSAIGGGGGVGTFELQEDFETLPAGEFTGFEGLAGANIVADPAMGGTNGQVGEIISSSAGQGWQGAQLLMQSNFIDITTNNTIEVDIYSDVAFTMFAKVEDNINTTAPASAADEAHTGSGWETLTFTFNEALDGTVAANGEYNLVAFFPNWNGSGWNTPPGDFTVYVDNIRGVTGSAIMVDTCTNGEMDGDETGVDCGGSCAPCAMPPATAAPTPPARPTADVVSIFSDAYTDVTVDQWGPDWGPSSSRINDITIATNASKVMEVEATQVFAGIDFAGSSTFDASTFTHFHLDYYLNSPLLDGQTFIIKLSNHVGGMGETSAIETVPTPQGGQWVSLDVPLADFTAASGPPNFNRSAIAQIVLTGGRTDTNVPVDIYLDNIYFHKNTVLSTDEFETASFKAFPNPTNGNWNISGNSVINTIAVFDILGKQVIALEPNSTETVINASSLNSGVYFARVTGLNGSKTVKLIKK